MNDNVALQVPENPDQLVLEMEIPSPPQSLEQSDAESEEDIKAKTLQETYRLERHFPTPIEEEIRKYGQIATEDMVFGD